MSAVAAALEDPSDVFTTAENPISKHFDELHHYTTADGLFGIVKLNEIWATNYAFTNDSKEFQEGRSSMEALLEESDAVSLANKRLIAESIIETAVSSGDHYITSLCGHRREYERLNGALGQWRGYGLDGGVALVLNTKGLEGQVNLYRHETKRRIVFERVSYGADDPLGIRRLAWMKAKYLPIIEEIAPDLIVARKSGSLENVAKVIQKQSGKIELFSSAMLAISIAFKHVAFQDEEEVRLCHVRPKWGGDTNYQVKRGAIVPYVTLGKPANITSVIRKVIVGPSLNQGSRAQGIEHFMRSSGLSVEIVKSETPLVR